MFSGFFEHLYFMEIVLALLVLSILFQIMIGVLYQKMIRETDNMAATENKLLKQCKLKFSNCYELNEGNVNVPVFVDKFISQFRFAGISLINMTHLSGQLMLLSVFTAGIGACKGIIEGNMLGELLPYYVVSLFGLYLYFSVSSFVDVKRKSNMVRTNLIDYLENHMVKHLNLTKDVEMQPFIIKDIIKNKKGTKAVIGIETASVEKETERSVAEPLLGIETAAEIRAVSGREEVERTEAVVEVKPATESVVVKTGDNICFIETEKRSVFSRQERDELEELLQEFLA